MAITLDQLQKNFEAKFGRTYIPENAEDSSDFYDFDKLKEEVFNHYDQEEDFKPIYKTAEGLLSAVITIMEWQHPVTCMVDILIDVYEQIEEGSCK